MDVLNVFERMLKMSQEGEEDGLLTKQQANLIFISEETPPRDAGLRQARRWVWQGGGKRRLYIQD